jgi:hypothetical protein
MFRSAFIATASALAFAVFASAVTDPAAMAAAPKCKNKANRYVACTDRLRAKTARKPKGESRAGQKDLKAELEKTKADDQ